MERDEEDDRRIKQSSYYNKTRGGEPNKNLQQFILHIRPEPGKAIDLGCGMGNDTVFLIRNDWEVISIDKLYIGEYSPLTTSLKFKPLPYFDTLN